MGGCPVVARAERLRHHAQMTPPRILIVIPAHWTRALLRAELREAGYDAVGARDLLEALAGDPAPPGPVRLILLDQEALAAGDEQLLEDLLARLRQRYPGALMVLLTSATHKAPEGPFQQVLRRPMSIADIVRAIERVVPLPPGERRPLD
jgi:CheY-like chemotaxis protein